MSFSNSATRPDPLKQLAQQPTILKGQMTKRQMTGWPNYRKTEYTKAEYTMENLNYKSFSFCLL